MAISQKCMKVIDPKDRISSLPEYLISDILSFLPTKYAVGTSALSTFWKDQWTLTPNLDFDDQLLAGAQKNSADKCTQMSFMNFVFQVLVLHKAPVIRRFRLHCSQPYDASHLNTWVSAALSHNVQELDFFIPRVGLSFVPRQLFTHSMLVKLKMGYGFLLKVPSLVSLQRLKFMHLSSVIFADDESFYRLLSGCPLLENLIITHCIWASGTVLNISSPTLKSLTIHDPYINGDDRYEVELDTPGLLHFTFYDEELPNCAFKKMNFLVKARLHVVRYGPESHDSINKITEGISTVQSLFLSDEFCKAVVFTAARLPTFHNLTSLAVGYNSNAAWELLPELLASSPKLKRLVLNDGLIGYADQYNWYEYKWCPPKSVPTCLSHHLQVMKVLDFEGNSEELKMIKYILMEAKVLRTLIIKLEPRVNAQDGFEVSKELLTFQRGSIACIVAISSDFTST